MKIEWARQAFASRVFWSILLLATSAQAQYGSNVQGFVLDPSGAAVSGTSVTLLNVDTGVQSTTKTSSTGNYRFSDLQPGNYVISSETSGFKRSEVRVTLGTGQTQGIDLHLAVATAGTSVTVTTEAAALDVDENRIQETLPADTVRDLPELNRNLWDVLAVAPGVVGTGTRGPGESPGGGADNFGTQTPQISANGRSYTGNLVMVDGLNVTSPVQNGNIILAPVPDAVQEASLETNSWNAENNLGSSVLIQITTTPAPAPGTEGNLQRNIYRNPGYFQVDASLLKNNHLPRLGEQGNLQLRIDFLNLFNHVNLGNVDPYMADGSNFGKVVTALPARQLELQAKFIF